MCWINSQNVRDLRTPFGGVKASGIGREGGDYAFDFYCETEIVHVALGSHHIPRLGMSRSRRRRMSAVDRARAPARPSARRSTSSASRTSSCTCATSRPREDFYADLLGMVVADRSRDAVYLRGWEERMHHSLVLRQGPAPAVARIGFRVRRRATTSSRSRPISRRAACRTRWADGPEPALGRVLRVWDPFGYPLEFFATMTRVEPQLQRFDLHRGAPILRFDHVNFHTPYMRPGVRVLAGARAFAARSTSRRTAPTRS